MKPKNIISQDVKRVLWAYAKREEYYKKVVCKRLERFDCKHEKTFSRIEDTVEYSLDLENEIFESNKKIIALRKALSDLSDSEMQMINECFFFEGKKPSYEDLAKQYGITRQAYCKRLNKLLSRLKPMVLFYLENE